MSCPPGDGRGCPCRAAARLKGRSVHTSTQALRCTRLILKGASPGGLCTPAASSKDEGRVSVSREDLGGVSKLERAVSWALLGTGCSAATASSRLSLTCAPPSPASSPASVLVPSLCV